MDWDNARVFLAIYRRCTLRGAAAELQIDQATAGRSSSGSMLWQVYAMAGLFGLGMMVFRSVRRARPSGFPFAIQRGEMQ